MGSVDWGKESGMRKFPGEKSDVERAKEQQQEDDILELFPEDF